MALIDANAEDEQLFREEAGRDQPFELEVVHTFATGLARLRAGQRRIDVIPLQLHALRPGFTGPIKRREFEGRT